MDSFFKKVYEIVMQIPSGKVATYGQIAKLLNAPRSSRAVGYALHKNPCHEKIPCHRVVNKEGRLSGSFAFGGENMQRFYLEQEGIEFLEDGTIDLDKFGWKIDF